MIDTAFTLNVRLLTAHRWGPGFDHSKGHVGFVLEKCKWDWISSPFFGFAFTPIIPTTHHVQLPSALFSLDIYQNKNMPHCQSQKHNSLTRRKNFKLYKRPSTHTRLGHKGTLTTIKRRHVCNYWLISNIPCLNVYTFHNHGTVCKSAHYIYEASRLEKRNFSATLGVYISNKQLYK
jgi:hypothetical protein